MQSERRHELGQNTLARELNTWGERLRPYTSVLLAVVAALLGVYIIVQLWNSYQTTRDRAAWDDYQLAIFQSDVEQRALQRLAASEDHEGTEMQEWALMGWADRQLLRAAQLYLSNREEANDRLNDVIGTYELFAESGSHPEIVNRAHLGLGRAFEMKNDLKQARAHYERVEGALADVAKQRLETLESEEVAETAKWLATVELPKPATPTGPGTPGARPGFEAAAPTADPATGLTTPSMADILGEAGLGDVPPRYATPEDPAGGENATDAGAESPAEASPSAPAGDEADVSDADPAASTTGAAPAEPAVEAPAAGETTTEPAAEENSDEQPATAADAPAEQ